MSDWDYCREHKVWLDADDVEQFLNHYPCSRWHLDYPPMSQTDQVEHNRMGHELLGAARNDLQRARAWGMILEAHHQRSLANAITLNLPPPERQRNPWMDQLYETMPSPEMEGQPG